MLTTHRADWLLVSSLGALRTMRNQRPQESSSENKRDCDLLNR